MTYNFQISTQNEVIAKLILEMLKGVEGIVIEQFFEGENEIKLIFKNS